VAFSRRHWDQSDRATNGTVAQYGEEAAIPGLQKKEGVTVSYRSQVEFVFVTMPMRYGGEKVSE
jgi:hypothetical protein